MTHEIAIVGGGTGGTVLANKLAEKLGPELDGGDVAVTLVSRDADQLYKPKWLYVPFGEATPEEARRPVRDLVDDRIDVRIEEVASIDTDAHELALAGGDRLRYDEVVVATGAELVPERVPGLKEGAHHFYGEAGAVRLRDALAEFDGGRLVLSVVGMPHMCPAAPYEFSLIVDDWLRKRGLREETGLVYTYPIEAMHAKPELAEWGEPVFADRDITVETEFVVTEVDPDAQVIHTEDGREEAYDLLVAIPPHTGSSLVRDSGLGEEGWIPVDQHTLEAETAEDVYAVGDAADVPTSKAGSVAHYEAGVVADRLAAAARGQTPTARYDGKTICFLEAGLDEATFISFDYDTPAVLRSPSKMLHWGKLAYNESYWLTAKGVM
jgi:sulfide:quinone oxidoreductase